MIEMNAKRCDLYFFINRGIPLGDRRQVTRQVTRQVSRQSSPQVSRQVIRLPVGDVFVGFGTVAAACAYVAFIAVAAAWLGTGSPTPHTTDAKAPIGSAVVARSLDNTATASAAAITGSPGALTGLVDTASFEARWANAIYEIKVFAGHQDVPRNAIASSEIRDRPQQTRRKTIALPEPDGRTAVYDIAAHTVYLPDGNKLEAHSGLGNQQDDPHYVGVKDQGPTPPNVYNLALREQMFHGIPAIRLNPVDEGRMFGRDGILAHPYMMSASGQSNGCVSIKDYPAFLNAFLEGEITRLVVVPHLEDTSWRSIGAVRGPTRRYAANVP